MPSVSLGCLHKELRTNHGTAASCGLAENTTSTQMTTTGIMCNSPWKNRLFISPTALERCWHCGFDTDARRAGSHSHTAVQARPKELLLSCPPLPSPCWVWLSVWWYGWRVISIKRKERVIHICLNSDSNWTNTHITQRKLTLQYPNHHIYLEWSASVPPAHHPPS